MKPWRTWLAGPGLLGALAIISGCGGGDVPDPGSDGQAALIQDSSAPPQPVAPAPAAPAPKPPGQEEKAEEPRTEVAAAPVESAPPAQKPAPPSNPPGAAGKAAAPSRGDATAEMLALATKEAPPPAAGGEGQGNNNAPGGPGGPGGAPGGPGGPPGAGGPGGMGMAMGMQSQMQQQQQMQSQMRNQMQGNMQGMRGGPGMPGGPGMAGGPGMPGGPGMAGGPGGNGAGSNQPPDFTDPRGAVQAFLDALKEKNLDRLNEATALRAPYEASPKNQEMFKRIIDNALSESELSALAARLDGYRISGENPVKSTGRVDVVVMKSSRNNSSGNTGGAMAGGAMGGGSFFRMRITVRREKKGWGVCDLSAPTEFKNPRMYNPYRRKR